METATNLSEVLKWLTGTGGGAFLLISWAIAWGLEGVPKWEALSSKLKTLIILGLSAVLGVLATWLLQFPDLVAAIDVYFRPVLYVVMVWLGSQTAHKVDKVVEIAKAISNQ